MKKRFHLFTVAMVFALSLLIPQNAKAAEEPTTPGLIKQTSTMLSYTDSGYYALKGAKEDWYKFQTPDITGYTNIHFKNTGMNDRAGIEVFNFIDESLYSDFYVYRNDDARGNIRLENGQTYYIKITGGNIGSTYVLDLSFTEDEAGNDKAGAVGINLNQDYIWSMDGYRDYDCASFTAPKTGKYKFLVKNTNVDNDMDFAVFKSSTDELLFNDNYIYKNDIAEAVLDLEKGQTYYFGFYAGDLAPGNYTFSVNNQTVKSITLNKSILTLADGATAQLVGSIAPANAFNTTVTWASNNSDVAYVDANGNVTARKPGNTLITCTANDGDGAISTCNVIVTPAKVNSPYTYASNSTISSLKIQWNSVDSVSGYTVYCYDSKSKKWLAVKTVNANTCEAAINSVKVNNTTKKLSAGTSYSFKVAAYVLVDKVKRYGEMSDSITSSTLPAAPTIKTVTNPYTDRVKLTWNKVNGASGYKIYKKDYYSDTYYYLGSTTGRSNTSYTYTGYGTGRYYYKVSAYRVVNNVTYEGAMGKVKALNKVR